MRLGNIGSVCIMNSTIIRLHWMWCVIKWHHLIPSIVLNQFQSHCVRRVCVCSIPFSFLSFHIFTLFHWVAELHVSRFYFITDTNRYDHNYQRMEKYTIRPEKMWMCIYFFWGNLPRRSDFTHSFCELHPKMVKYEHAHIYFGYRNWEVFFLGLSPYGYLSVKVRFPIENVGYFLRDRRQT